MHVHTHRDASCVCRQFARARARERLRVQGSDADCAQKISQLQQRLELASIKTNHGWSDMSINEIETRLPTSQEQKRTPQVVNGGGHYDPPSPSRPWQLADVLWQPLPQPGRSVPTRVSRPPGQPFHAPSHSLPGHLPSAANGSTPRVHPPNSPRRHRMDEYLNRPQASPLRHSSKNGSGHRRASSSISSLQFLNNDPYRGGSPLRPKAKGSAKKRSQSHSNLREAHAASAAGAGPAPAPQHRPTTQDVDAARALTSMLGSVRSPTDGQFPQHQGQPPPPGGAGAHPRAMQLPPLHTSSLPGPFAPDMPPPRPRAQSFAAESREPFEHALGHERKRSTEYRPYLPPLRRHGGPTHSRGLSMDSSAAFRERFAPPPWPQAGGPGPDERFRERSGERGERYGSSERYAERYPSAERYGPGPGGPGPGGPGPERYGYGAAFGYGPGGPGPGGPPPGGPPHGGPGYDAYRVEEEPMEGRGEEDKAAAELMMFLATSPSPVRGKREHAHSIAGTARVLFDDREPPPYPRPGPPPLSAAPRR